MDRFAGIVVPLLTPLDEKGALDAVATRQSVDHVVAAGAGGLLVAGTTGEALALPAATRLALIDAACAAARKRTATMVGIGSTCLEDTLAYERQARAAGADAVLLQPPPYFPLAAEELLGYYLKVLERTELPLILYNIPDFTRNNLPVELAERLMHEPRVLGIKDSSGDPACFAQLMQRCASATFFVHVGTDSRIALSAEQGAHGCTPGVANVFPELCVRCFAAAREGRGEEARALQQELMSVSAPLRSPTGWVETIARHKQALAARGIMQPHLSLLLRR